MPKCGKLSSCCPGTGGTGSCPCCCCIQAAGLTPLAPAEGAALPAFAACANDPGTGGTGAAPFSETDICATPLTSDVGGGGPLGGGGGPAGGIGTLRSPSEAVPPEATAMTGVPGGGGGPGGGIFNVGKATVSMLDSNAKKVMFKGANLIF